MAFAADGHCEWRKYDLARKQTMCFDTVSQLANDPLSVSLALWKGVLWLHRH
jgi:hypothetical protein